MSDKLEKDLKEMFDEIPEPDGRRDRAMFTAGVATRRPPPVWRRALVPATAIFLVLFALSIGSLGASPGQTLYPLRKALSPVVGQPVEVVDRVIRRAEISLERAEERLDENEDFSGARAMTEQTISQLGEARGLLNELSGEAREERAEEINDLEEDAYKLLEDIDEEQTDAAADAREESGDDDSSGPGSGSDDGDSSGPGSGGSDNSGSGSGSSGSGSGSSDSGDSDNSGSGSGSSGSGSDDDSSGPGSGSDD